MSGLARYLEKLYKNGRATETTLNNAVDRGWITAEEKDEILNL